MRESYAEASLNNKSFCCYLLLFSLWSWNVYAPTRDLLYAWRRTNPRTDSGQTCLSKSSDLPASWQAKKYEISRLETALNKHETTDKLQRETIACISRHWCALTEELKGALQRLEHSPVDIRTEQQEALLESLATLKVGFVGVTAICLFSSV